MSSSFGKKITFTVFGQSHSEGIGIVMDGLPPGETIDLVRVNRFMQRRAPGRNAGDTPRREADAVRVLSGLLDGKTCGAPLCGVIENTDVRSGDYAALRDVPRPGHADYPVQAKCGGAQDRRGGGHTSGRLTAPLCFAGAVCLQILERRGVCIGAHLQQIAGESERQFSCVELTQEELLSPGLRDFPVLEPASEERFRAQILAARQSGDSIGGVIECAATGLPPGLGEPMFGGIENRLAAALFGVPGCRGVEFGAGFAAAALRGSQNNDAYCLEGDQIRTKTNQHGGVLGGMATGMPLIFRIAMKPTPSIALAQQSVDLASGEATELRIGGRHDACIAPRAVPVVEAIAAMALLDMMEELPWKR
ncbi:MAG: chorismate synthase [Oscillospiraceae bacterium]|jgi:chorismate synthase|nr:chorismate synthase [Oscillospiraceae bacterium]